MTHEELFRKWSNAPSDEHSWEQAAGIDYASPDPAWDYAGLWLFVHQQLKPQIEEMVFYLASVENANNESDARLREYFQGLLEKIEEGKRYL